MESEEARISLDAYAAVLAALGAGLSLSRALHHGGVSPAEWDEGSLQWQGRIDESAAGDLGVLVAFDAALIAEKRAFEPVVSPIDGDAEAWAHFRRHFLTAVDPVGFLAEQGISLSRYARLEADWGARALGDEGLSATLQGHMGGPLQACPRITLTPSPLLDGGWKEGPSAVEIPEVEPPSAALVDSPPPPVPLPLPSMSVPAQAPPAIVPLRRGGVGMTGEIDLSRVRAALPFARDAVAGPAPPTVTALRPLGAGEVDRTGTLPADLVAMIARGALPFAAGKGPVPAALPAPKPNAPPKAPLGTTTGALPALRPAEPALPFQVASGPTEMSLERYASLCAELSVRPAESEAIFARHGLGVVRERVALDLLWQERLRRSPEEYRAWQELYQRYRAHWADPRKGPIS